jgi:hypothetical protein
MEGRGMTAAEIAVAPGVGKTAFGRLRSPEANLKDKAEAVQITQNVELPAITDHRAVFAFGSVLGRRPAAPQLKTSLRSPVLGRAKPFQFAVAASRQ